MAHGMERKQPVIDLDYALRALKDSYWATLVLLDTALLEITSGGLSTSSSESLLGRLEQPSIWSGNVADLLRAWPGVLQSILSSTSESPSN